MQNLTYSLETSVPVFQLDFFKQLANCEWENIMNNFTWHDHIHRSYMVYFITVSEDLNIYTCLFQFQRACNYLLCGLCACLIFFITILSYSSLVFTDSAFEPCLVCYFVALHCTSWEAVPSCRCVLRWKHSCSFALHFEDWGKHVWKYLLFCFELFWNKSLL